jgi:Mg2+-importing ATPase
MSFDLSFKSLNGGNPGPGGDAPIPRASIEDWTTAIAGGPASEALDKLQASLEGLTPEQVEDRLLQHGPNEVSHEKPPTWFQQLLHASVTPFNGVLAAVSVVTMFTDIILARPGAQSYGTLSVLVTMILLSSILRFWQEFRSTKAAEALKAMVRATAAVLRAGDEAPQERLIATLVPGDIVHLSAGDMIPADVRLLSAKDLFVSQAMLTGEAIPVEKHADVPPPSGAPQSNDAGRSTFELPTICFMGTNVVSGIASGVVIATGDRTYFGAISKNLSTTRPLTGFDKGIRRVSWMLVRFVAVVTPVVFVLNGVTKGDWLEALLFSVAVAVGLTPEMLPMVVTANLGRGALAMAKRKAIVKRLNAIQNFGAMDILCTDKTGTLTQNRVVLERHLDVHGRPDAQVLQYAWLNSFHQTGLKNLLDHAVLEYAAAERVIDEARPFRKVDEIPFDFMRRRMSVVVRNGGNKNLLICKGAIEELLPLCASADDNGAAPGGIVPLSAEKRAEVRRITREMNHDGLRALAVAYKWTTPDDRTYTAADEQDLVLAGYIAFLDPPKETTAEALAALRDHGVEVKVITGDNEFVTRKICKEVGLDVAGALSGSDVDGLSDAELPHAAGRTSIFTKMSPLQKSRVIRALKAAGHTVGYLGDGINDAAALKDADVGISVDTAVDIAKESADIILLEKSLMVLEEAVVEGRRTFGNITKYLKMTLSSNFGNVFSVLIASAFLPFLPMLPIQFLVQNLLYDISQISIPWDNVDEDYLRRPREWNANGLARFMVCIGPVSSIFDIVTFLVMWHVFHANTIERQALFQSGWFVVGLLTQTLIVHMIRTRHIPFIESRAGTPVLALTAVIMMLGVALPMLPLGARLDFVPLPVGYFPWMVAILAAYVASMQFIKRFYIHRYSEWL